jgi:hypothetical protein
VIERVHDIVCRTSLTASSSQPVRLRSRLVMD